MSRQFSGQVYGLVVALLVLAFGATPPSALGIQPPTEDAQEVETGAGQIPQISDEPKTIDPATLMPAALAAKVTQDFSDSSLRELISWLQQENELVVLLDYNELAQIGVAPSEPVSDRITDAPLYLLLNRLRSLGLSWYYQDEILHITSKQVAEEQSVNRPYNIADLLDADHKLKNLINAIVEGVSPVDWTGNGGQGELFALGDVLFVRQYDQVQREVEGLLDALRNHGRQTFVLDPPQHIDIRRKLDEPVSVNFVDTPLEEAVAQLSQSAEIDIRLDSPTLRELRIREREPVSLNLANRKLETVLQAMIVEHELTWMLRDGVLWITSPTVAEENLKAAVYDVRDLCRDDAESNALVDALISQASPLSWLDNGGQGSIHFAKPGVMVVTQTEQAQRDVLNLLETYRTALRSSRPRVQSGEDPDEVITVYYRMHANVAADLATKIPRLIQPGSWTTGFQNSGDGEVTLVASEPEIPAAGADGATEASMGQIAARSVLIIRQKRAIHDEIRELISRVEFGDSQNLAGGGSGFGGGGLGGGLGGFGGGFFVVPNEDSPQDSDR